MKSFRRSKPTAKAKPRIHATSVAPLAAIASLPAQVRAGIGSEEQVMCLVSVESSNRRYTLVLDLEWVALAVDVDQQPGELIGDLPLPRAAVHAVVSGWSPNDAFAEPVTRWSDDDIPHVGFPPVDDPGLSLFG